MENILAQRKILLQLEALRSKMEIKEYLISTIIHEMYENIGQSLSLVRIYLVSLKSVNANIPAASKLVERSIKEIKNLCRLFKQDIELDTDTGWIKMLDYTIQTLNLGQPDPIGILGTPVDITMSAKLIIARMVQEILIHINHCGLQFIKSRISFSKNGLHISIDTSKGAFFFEDIKCKDSLNDGLKCLSFNEKARLINAVISKQIIEKGLNRIIIKVSLTSLLNE